MSKPVPLAPAAEAPTARTYRAFLSYSHTDTKWAVWLLRRLESFRVPERFHGRTGPIGELGPRLAPVFRDRDELPTADDLGDAVRDALARSATLIVICSPASARSRWVNEEIVAFKRLGRSDRVFAFIVEGEPGAKDAAQECFPKALRFAVEAGGGLSVQPVELIAADARPHGDGKGSPATVIRASRSRGWIRKTCGGSAKRCRATTISPCSSSSAATSPPPARDF